MGRGAYEHNYVALDLPELRAPYEGTAPAAIPLTIDGLWSLTFGNGFNGGDVNTLYFTAGINGEQDGLFGSLTFVPGVKGSPTGK